MREIKFRAWDTKRKKMFSAEEMGQDELTLSPDGRGFVNVSGTSTRLSHYLPHLIPEQYTGLKDKNGVEIYEGDIITIDSSFENKFYKGNVYWNWKLGMFRLKGFDQESFVGALLAKPDYEAEVIGDIHHNPELLEQGREDERNSPH